MLEVDGKEHPPFQKYLTLKRIKKIPLKNKVRGFLKKYCHQFKTKTNELKNKLNVAKNLQELEEVYNSLKSLYKNDKNLQKIHTLYAEAKFRIVVQQIQNILNNPDNYSLDYLLKINNSVLQMV